MRVRVSPGPPSYAPLAERFTRQPQELWPSGIWVRIPGDAPKWTGFSLSGRAEVRPMRRRKPSYGLAAARSKRERPSGRLGSRPSVSAMILPLSNRMAQIENRGRSDSWPNPFLSRTLSSWAMDRRSWRASIESGRVLAQRRAARLTRIDLTNLPYRRALNTAGTRPFLRDIRALIPVSLRTACRDRPRSFLTPFRLRVRERQHHVPDRQSQSGLNGPIKRHIVTSRTVETLRRFQRLPARPRGAPPPIDAALGRLGMAFMGSWRRGGRC